MATDANLSAVLHGPEDLRMEPRPLVQPGPGQVLVRIRATGLCGSDLHYYLHGRNGDFALAHPMCLGHESSGEVVSVGSGVEEQRHLSVGARVVVEPGVNCTTCSFCQEGRYNLCSMMRFASSAKTSPHLDGTLQRFIVWPARLCHVIPDALPLRTAALVEPLAVVLQALSRSNMRSGQTILIMGAGAVGLLTAMAAKAHGAKCVAAMDIDKDRLSFGVQNGWIDHAHCIAAGEPQKSKDEKSETLSHSPPAIWQKEAIEKAKRLSQDFMTDFGKQDLAVQAGFDIVFECTGVPSCIQSAIFAAKAGGKVTLIGMGHPIVTVPLSQAALREVDIIGVFRYANMFPRAIELLSNAPLSNSGSDGEKRETKVDRLVSHVFPLEQAVNAFQTLKAGQSADGKRLVKVIVVDHEENPSVEE